MMEIIRRRCGVSVILEPYTNIITHSLTYRNLGIKETRKKQNTLRNYNSFEALLYRTYAVMKSISHIDKLYVKKTIMYSGTQVTYSSQGMIIRAS